MKTLYILSALVVMVLGSFGTIMFTTLLHEMSHKRDLIDYAYENDDEICLLSSNMLGYYEYSVDKTTLDDETFQKIIKYTEIKAYSVSVLSIILYVAAFLFTIYRIDGFKTP